VKNRDTKLLNLDQDIQNLEKWFDGRKFELEKIFRATEDGFHFDKSRPKVNSKNDIIFVVESGMGGSPSVWQIKQSLGYRFYQEMMGNYPLDASIALN
jgi:hypothetical protein